MSMKDFDINALDWQKMGDLIPAIIQDVHNQSVLMLGYMNKAALEKTLKTQQVTFYSRSKKRLWVKGETSGNYLKLVNVVSDCDNDTLLIQAMPSGPVCHLGYDNCFKTSARQNFQFITQLETLIKQRKQQRPAHSYVTRLLDAGIERIAQKIGEEGVEVALAAVKDNKTALCEEMADLLFHMLVMLSAYDLNLQDVLAVLQSRHTSD